MQYTLRGVPRALDRALRQRAKREKKSLNTVALQVLAEAVGIDSPQRKRRTLADLAGSWAEDRAFDESVADQRRVDLELWR
ncbi:MAG TPA: hypothetical protein VF331_23160 [Polyangiales bacterium]